MKMPLIELFLNHGDSENSERVFYPDILLMCFIIDR